MQRATSSQKVTKKIADVVIHRPWVADTKCFHKEELVHKRSKSDKEKKRERERKNKIKRKKERERDREIEDSGVMFKSFAFEDERFSELYEHQEPLGCAELEEK